MSSYVDLIKQDVHCHDDCDASAWPPFILELIRSMQNELKIPSWLKSNSVPYASDRVIHLLDHLQASDDASNLELWDDMDMEDRQCVVFNTSLADCSRIRAVVEAEDLADTLFPKESFLVVLVRNAIFNAHLQLSSLEDVPVVLPRHFNGETIPILKYMRKSFYAPLIVAIPQEMPFQGSTSDSSHVLSDKKDSVVESELFKHSPPSLSEWLDGCDRTKTPEEVEELEEGVLSSQFDAYFLQSLPSAAPPSICHIPVLCMADEEQLPVLMSSLLYQRRVWRISEPLVGLGFSKYDTTIKLFLGWLEDDPSAGRILPRVHLGEIETPIKLDLSSPSAALVVSRFLCGLGQRMFDPVRCSVGEVVTDTQSHSSLSWRIDTDTRNERSVSLLDNDNTRDVIIRWLKSQKCPEVNGQMLPRKKIATSLLGSGTSEEPTSTQPSYPISLVQDSSASQSAQVQEPRESCHSVPTFMSRLSCSDFAATSECTDKRVFRWMFDRRVVPQSIPSDLEFCEEYSSMTGFIWPETWRVREDLPSVDIALEPCIQVLLEGVATLKERPGAIRCIPEKDFPVDLRTLEQSFSAIFQASRRCREKTKLQEVVPEVAWRHDHDRLLYDFFIRLIQPGKGSAVHPLMDGYSVAHLEDPLSRPTLETTLRFPKSDNMQVSDRFGLQRSILALIHPKAIDLQNWLEIRGGSLDSIAQEVHHASYVNSQWTIWRQETNAETEAQMISKLGGFPSTGKCDALGRLVVELPKVSSKATGNLALIVRAAKKDGGNKGRNEAKAPTMGSDALTGNGGKQGERPTKVSNNSLTIPDSSPIRGTSGTRYSMVSSAVRPSTHSSSDVKRGLAESIDALVSKTQGLQLGPNVTRLELPILVAEYKKASEHVAKGTNQLRMYLTACVKFLHAVGITNFPVYGVQTDGPIVVLPVAVLRDDKFVYLFERLVERLDISTPLGAWHYATILCRLAQNHAKVLEDKFEAVKEDFVTSLLHNGRQMEGWTLDDQMNRLKAENKAKSPLQDSKKK